jgi:DNA-binding beta-propeller fold protein YncE
VTPINTATNTALRPIKVGRGARAIAITPNGKTAYVASYKSGTVTRSASPPTPRSGRSGSAEPRTTSRSPRTGRPPTLPAASPPP